MTSVANVHLALKKAAFALLFLFLVGCSQTADDFIRISGNTMGTQYNITARNPGGLTAKQLKADLDQRLTFFNNIASSYIEASELNRFNAAPVGEWREMSSPLHDIFSVAFEVSLLSAGAFDVTVGPLVELWGFGVAKSQQRPSEAAIKAALATIGYQYLQMEMGSLRLRKTAAVQVDLSAIAKGYGVDAAANWLGSLGVEDYLVEIGGELRVAGHS
ncbi:MAG: FAD:protein FMN transferase, partial [Spongiibacteraceae bacterium]